MLSVYYVIFAYKKIWKRLSVLETNLHFIEPNIYLNIFICYPIYGIPGTNILMFFKGNPLFIPVTFSAYRRFPSIKPFLPVSVFLCRSDTFDPLFQKTSITETLLEQRKQEETGFTTTELGSCFVKYYLFDVFIYMGFLMQLFTHTNLFYVFEL